MAAPTFLETLKREVARMQAVHPEREGELARAHALILHGQVLPSDDDPQAGQVLSSDGATHYTVNGTCSCQAGQHGKPCKHLQAWKLYQYIAGKLARRTEALLHVQADLSAPAPPALPAPLPEAPASVNVRVTISGREVQWTLRDTDEARLAARLEALLARYPVPQPAPQAASQPQGKDWCPIHQTAMRQTTKEGRSWFSHKVDGRWCKGK
jgi:hypothetical protein